VNAISRLIGTTVDRLKKMLMLRIISDVSADFTEAEAARRADLERRAAEYERDGHHGSAAQLRQAASRVGVFAVLDATDAELDRLIASDPLSAPWLVSGEVAAGAGVLALSTAAHAPTPEPEPRRTVGRPRKLPADVTAVTRRPEGM
jgi:hypothetical protein